MEAVLCELSHAIDRMVPDSDKNEFVRCRYARRATEISSELLRQGGDPHSVAAILAGDLRAQLPTILGRFRVTEF
jgi:hypothetical protein